MDETIPGGGIYDPGGWGNMGFVSPPGGTQSQVPGTMGEPQGYTPSATPGGVATGSPPTHAASGYTAAPMLGGGQQSPWGSLAGILGLGAPQSAAGAMQPGQGQKIAQLGMRMLQPPASPLRQGAPMAQLSNAGQNPMLEQIQRMFGVDPATAQMMMSTLMSGTPGMSPAQNPQTSGGLFAPTVQPTQLQSASAMPTAAQPYGAPRMGMATPTGMLPQLGQGAFQSALQMPGSFAPSMPQQQSFMV